VRSYTITEISDYRDAANVVVVVNNIIYPDDDPLKPGISVQDYTESYAAYVAIHYKTILCESDSKIYFSRLTAPLFPLQSQTDTYLERKRKQIKYKFYIIL
jgi:hypothetical protein